MRMCTLLPLFRFSPISFTLVFSGFRLVAGHDDDLNLGFHDHPPKIVDGVGQGTWKLSELDM